MQAAKYMLKYAKLFTETLIMFSNFIRLNAEGNPIKVNSLGIHQEECFGFSSHSGKLEFENSISVTLIDKNNYILIVKNTSPETISILNSDYSELFSCKPPQLNNKYLSFLYPQIHKNDRKLIGLVFTDGKTDYKTSFSLENLSYGEIIVLPK